MLGLATEADPLACLVDFQNADFNHITNGNDLRRIRDELIGEFTDVDQTVLVDADINKGTEIGDVADGALELHPGTQVIHRGDIVGIHEARAIFPGIAPRLDQFGCDIAQGRDTNGFRDKLVPGNGVNHHALADQLRQGFVDAFSHGFHHSVTLRMDRRVVQWVGRFRNAQESGCLFKGLWPEATNRHQIRAGFKHARLVAMGNDGLGQGRADAGYIRQKFEGGRV